MTSRASKPSVPAAPADPVLEAARNAPVEAEDEDERRAVEAAIKAGGVPVPGEQVTAMIAERLRNAK
jgi:hypothetical protein